MYYCNQRVQLEQKYYLVVLQVLLFRGADPTLVNRQGQTAVQVAQIVGTFSVADVIQGHSPHSVG